MIDSRKGMPHPMQPVNWDGKGVIRFKPNAIIQWMLEQGAEAHAFDLNTIACQGQFSDADSMQLAQLLGYSVSGYCDLSYVSDRSASQALRRSEKAASQKGP